MPRVELDEATNAKLVRLEVILREPSEQIVDRALMDYLMNGEGSYLLAVSHTPTIDGPQAYNTDDVIQRLDAIHDLYGRMVDAEDGVEVAFLESELVADLKPQLAFLPKTLPEIATQVLGNPAASLDDIMGFVSERCGLTAEAIVRRAVNWYLTLGDGGSMLSKSVAMPKVAPIMSNARAIIDKRRRSPTTEDSSAVAHGTGDRIALPVEALSEAEMEDIRASRITTSEPYNLSDLPDEGDELPPGFKR